MLTAWHWMRVLKGSKRRLTRAAKGTIRCWCLRPNHGDMLQSQGLPLKQFPWDESIRVPFLVRYPRLLGRKKRQLATPIDAPDIMPTLLGLAGLTIPDSVQGQDYSGLLTGKKREAADPFALLNLPASFSVIRRHGCSEYRGVRTTRYTYVRSIHGPWLLYDNQADPFQKRNLAGVKESADLQGRLDRMLESRLRQLNDDFLPGSSYIERARSQPLSGSEFTGWTSVESLGRLAVQLALARQVSRHEAVFRDRTESRSDVGDHPECAGRFPGGSTGKDNLIWPRPARCDAG